MIFADKISYYERHVVLTLGVTCSRLGCHCFDLDNSIIVSNYKHSSIEQLLKNSDSDIFRGDSTSLRLWKVGTVEREVVRDVGGHHPEMDDDYGVIRFPCTPFI